MNLKERIIGFKNYFVLLCNESGVATYIYFVLLMDDDTRQIILRFYHSFKGIMHQFTIRISSFTCGRLRKVIHKSHFDATVLPSLPQNLRFVYFMVCPCYLFKRKFYSRF